MKKTKIICTLGPAVDSEKQIEKLIHQGMNIARLNFSHGSYEEHGQRMAWVKNARRKCGVSCAIMLDTKGPEIRVGDLPSGKIVLQSGQIVCIGANITKECQLSIHPISVISCIEVGMRLLFNDGSISSIVIEKNANSIKIQVVDGGVLTSRKGVNIPGAHVGLPALTQNDVEDLIYGCKMDVDLIAASFIRSAEHVLSIKKLLSLHEKADIPVIAKIENHEGIQNFDSIVQVADGIMVARGDLGVEMEPSLVPKLQKMMVRKCFDACKPVTIATQMLESMMQNPRATRAEVSDVANAIYDGASSIMLSAETSVGKYPIEAVRLMADIARVSEQDFNNQEFYYLHSRKDFPNISSAIAVSAVKTAYTSGAKAIFAFTTSGLMVRLISRFMPEMPIITVTADEKIYHQLSYYWGVHPIFASFSGWKEGFSIASSFALEKKLISFGDLVVVTAGSHFGCKGSTNMMMVESIGSVLVRGEKGFGKTVSGKIKVYVLNNQHTKEDLDDCIIVLAKCDPSYLDLMRSVRGVILENHIDDIDSLHYAIDMAKMYKIPLIVQAEHAVSTLQEEEMVVLNPAKAIVYKEE